MDQMERELRATEGDHTNGKIEIGLDRRSDSPLRLAPTLLSNHENRRCVIDGMVVETSSSTEVA